jgi:integrase
VPKYTGVIKRYNRWYYRISIKGKWKEFGSYPSQEKAYRARLEHLHQIRIHEATPHNISFYEFTVKYLNEHVKTHNRIATLVKAESICRNHIIPELGKYRLHNITAETLLDFRNRLVTDKTPSVAYNAIRTVKRILNKAVEWDYLTHSPMKKGMVPSRPEKEHPTLPLEQIHEVIRTLKGRDKYIVALMGLAGLRRSEVFGLRWEDFNFQTKELMVKRQFTQGRIEPTKTAESKAVIPLCEDLTALIHKEWKLQSGSPEWVFKGFGNKPLSGEWWGSTQWPKIKKIYGFPREFRIHDFRHSFATILIKKGVPLDRVQLLLRHKSLQTTYNLYRHLLPAELTREVSVLNAGCSEGYSEGIKTS